MSNSPIRPIDRTQSGATTLGQSGPGNDDNEEVPHIPQSYSITGASPLDRLVSYPGHCRDAVSVFYSPSRLGNFKN